jgi:hypothetical protein
MATKPQAKPKPPSGNQIGNAPESETVEKAAGGKLVQPKPPTQKDLATENAETVYLPSKEHATRTAARAAAARRKEETEERAITLPARQWEVIDRFAEMAKVDVSVWLERHFSHMAKG